HIANRDVLRHASEHAAKLRSKGHAFIGANFRAYVRTHQDFTEARALLVDPELAKRLLKIREPTDVQVADLEAEQPDFIGKMELKLRKLSPGAHDAAVREQRVLSQRAHLRCENLLNDLLD